MAEDSEVKTSSPLAKLPTTTPAPDKSDDLVPPVPQKQQSDTPKTPTKKSSIAAANTEHQTKTVRKRGISPSKQKEIDDLRSNAGQSALCNKGERRKKARRKLGD